MRRHSTTEYTRLKAIQSDAMNDQCNIHHIVYSSGTYGNKQTETLTGSFNVACGIEFTGGQVVERGASLFVDYDVILRLPATVSIFMDDEIQLIEKGDIVISGTFQPHSQPTVTSSVQHVQLKRKV